MNEFNKEIFLKAYSHYNHTLKKKTAMSQKRAPQRPICNWQFAKCSSWWFLFKTRTPLFSSIKKLGSDKISWISLFRNDLGHAILRIPAASLFFDASDIRSSGVVTFQGKCGWITNPATRNCTSRFRQKHIKLWYVSRAISLYGFHASCFLWLTEVYLLLKI